MIAQRGGQEGLGAVGRAGMGRDGNSHGMEGRSCVVAGREDQRIKGGCREGRS